MTSCSSVSVQKSPDQRSKSSDTVCSSNSGCFLQKRKPIHPLAATIRPSFSNTSSKSSNVRQRVLSAKLLKLRSLQCQIHDANFHLNELRRENQALKTLNQRQERALTKYEGTNADLPRLLNSHNEEVRVLSEKNKSLRKTARELTDIIKARDDELLQLKKHLEHLEKLNRNKHLGERQKLTEQVEDLKMKIDSAENQISTLNRKLLLEEKSSKQRLMCENTKHKECQRNLMQALAEIERLTGLVDVNSINNNKKEDKLPLRKKSTEKDAKPNHKVNVSLFGRPSNETIKDPPNGVTEILKPIRTRSTKSEEKDVHDDNGDDIDSPKENLKARRKIDRKIKYHFDKSEDVSSLSDSEQYDQSHRNSNNLEGFSSNIDSIIQRSKENGLSQFDRTLGDYCNQVLNTVKNCSKVVEDHQESLNICRTDTETLRDAVEEVKALDDQLKRNIFSVDSVEFKALLKQGKAEKTFEQLKLKEPNRNMDTRLKDNPKAKLLATLRAIDNGDYIDHFGNDKSTDEIYDSYAN